MKNYPFSTPVVIGLSDGLIVPFAFIAGLSNIMATTGDVVSVVWIVILFAAILMSIGGYFTIKQEVNDQHSSIATQQRQVKSFYANIGLPQELQEQAAQEIMSDRETWETVSAGDEGKAKDPVTSAIIIGVCYILAGLISLLPYFFTGDIWKALKISAIITIPLLFITGYLKHYLTDKNTWTGAFQQAFIGLLAALGAYCVSMVIS